MYADDIAAPGEAEFESVVSVARPGSSSGLRGHVGQALGEVNFGLGKGLAIGLELPASWAEGRLREEGLAIEVEYLAAHDKAGGWFAGIRGDVGRLRSVVEYSSSADIELDPIIGYRGADYRVVFNPSLERPLGGDEPGTRLRPSAKVAARSSTRDELGAEYFGDWGPLRDLLPATRRDESVYLVWDRKTSSGRLNMGVGQGLHPSNGSVDEWVVKLGLRFDAD